MASVNLVQRYEHFLKLQQEIADLQVKGYVAALRGSPEEFENVRSKFIRLQEECATIIQELTDGRTRSE